MSSTLLYAYTDFPVKAVVGADTRHEGNSANDRPARDGFGANRSSFLQPGFFNRDIRMVNEFRVGESSVRES